MAPLPKQLCDSISILSHIDKVTESATTTAAVRKLEIVWRNVFIFTLLHIGALYGLYLKCFEAMWRTVIFVYVGGYIAALGITAGAHRLWTHRCYKARLPLQLILLYLNSMCLQNSVIDWARDHRMHHKHSDTDADPHNSSRGFFFAHVGWLLVRKHPAIKAKAHTIDMSDLMEDPLLRFQKKYYVLLGLLTCFVIPTYVSTLLGDTLWNSFFVCGVYRYVHTLNITWLVNSAAHMWGYSKPYDKTIMPVETKMVSLLASGEGFHNYHHTFPWDYKTAELGNYTLNITTMFIDAMARIGWAYDLKTVSPDIIRKRAQRTGDGSHKVQNWTKNNNLPKNNSIIKENSYDQSVIYKDYYISRKHQSKLPILLSKFSFKKDLCLN